jgi:amino acid transporter
VAYAYIGVEIIAVVALEAKIAVHPPGRNRTRNSGNSLKYPAKLIAWITALIYFLSAFSYYMNVSWLDPSLPGLGSRDNAATFLNRTQAAGNSTAMPSMKTPRTNSIVVIALDNAGLPALAGFVNGCLIVAVLSAANTALYVASRTLFGLTKAIGPDSRFWGWFSVFSTTTPGRRVPAPALFISALAFCWIPFLHLAKRIRYSYQEVGHSLLFPHFIYAEQFRSYKKS